MSDRLADLRRQRALVQEQLNWFDAEINAAQPPPPAAKPDSRGSEAQAQLFSAPGR